MQYFAYWIFYAIQNSPKFQLLEHSAPCPKKVLSARLTSWIFVAACSRYTLDVDGITSTSQLKVMVHQTASRVATKQLKSKGLQKLRWYCQLCEKQCRDENGFKCHCASDAHLRRVQLFGENPKRAIDEYSETFEQNFLKHLQLS